MNVLDLLRFCIHRDRGVLAKLGYKWFTNLWTSDVTGPPKDTGWVLLGVTSTSIPAHLPLEMVVNDEVVAKFALSEAIPALVIEPGSQVQVRLLAYIHEYGEKKIMAGNVSLLGWAIEDWDRTMKNM